MRRDDICLYVGPANRSRLEAIVTDRTNSSKVVWLASACLVKSAKLAASELDDAISHLIEDRTGADELFVVDAPQLQQPAAARACR